MLIFFVSIKTLRLPLVLENLYQVLAMSLMISACVRLVYLPHIYPLQGFKDLVNFLSHKALSHILSNYRNKGTKGGLSLFTLEL